VSDSAFAGSVNEAATPGRPRAFNTILYGGLAVGVLDILDAMTFFGIRNGLTPIRVLQSVARGLLGSASYSGGLKTALLGLLLHFLIAFILATVYYVASGILPLVIRHAVPAGLIYGVAVYFVMTYVVLPYSAVGPRSAPIPWLVFLNGVIGHALLVGLPIALIARRSAKADKRNYRSPT
jgi:uncharacterized membrane protein YagU involved in acid resistance